MSSINEREVPCCQHCGAPLPNDLTDGVCLRCALGNAVESVGSAANLAPVPEQSSTLRRFGDYELFEEIGRGGMGAVYRARQISLNRFVAVKMLLAGGFAGTQFVRRFRAEASAAALLQHPNIVAIHEVGVHEGQNYFTMEYIRGQNL